MRIQFRQSVEFFSYNYDEFYAAEVEVTFFGEVTLETKGKIKLHDLTNIIMFFLSTCRQKNGKQAEFNS